MSRSRVVRTGFGLIPFAGQKHIDPEAAFEESGPGDMDVSSILAIAASATQARDGTVPFLWARSKKAPLPVAGCETLHVTVRVSRVATPANSERIPQGVMTPDNSCRPWEFPPVARGLSAGSERQASRMVDAGTPSCAAILLQLRPSRRSCRATSRRNMALGRPQCLPWRPRA